LDHHHLRVDVLLAGPPGEPVRAQPALGALEVERPVHEVGGERDGGERAHAAPGRWWWGGPGALQRVGRTVRGRRSVPAPLAAALDVRAQLLRGQATLLRAAGRLGRAALAPWCQRGRDQLLEPGLRGLAV